MPDNKYDPEAEKAMTKEETKEHPKFSKAQIHQIVMDHLKIHPMANHKHFKKISEAVAAMEAGEDEGAEGSNKGKVQSKNQAKDRVEKMVKEHTAKHGK